MATTKTTKLLNKLRAGKKLTAEQIMNQCDFISVNSVYGTISALRADGAKINSGKSRAGLTQYHMA